MKIGMMLHDVQDFGGLEEYAATLAIGLRQAGHEVRLLCDTYVASDNQYLRRLRDNGVPLLQLPQWLSRPASDWPTKERILRRTTRLLAPLAYPLAALVCLQKRSGWSAAVTSARNWLRGVLMDYVIGPDRRKLFMRPLLDWWRLSWGPNVLHVQGYTSNLLYVVDWAHARGLPVVYEEHQTPDARFDWWQQFPGTINKAAVVVAVSAESGRALRTVCGVTQPVVVRAPLLPDPITSRRPDLDRRRDGGRGLRITTVARLGVTKGLTYLLDAVALIKPEYPDVELRVYGDGELREELVAHADRLGLDGKAIFVGAFTRREDLSTILTGTDIFVLSSILEGQPLALVEAMAHGCSIVATTVGGIPELIEDGVNGLLCPPCDADCLASQIRHLARNAPLRAELARAARRSYEQGPFQPRAVCGHFVSVYESVLNPSPTAATAAL